MRGSLQVATTPGHSRPAAAKALQKRPFHGRLSKASRRQQRPTRMTHPLGGEVDRFDVDGRVIPDTGPQDQDANQSSKKALVPDPIRRLNAVHSHKGLPGRVMADMTGMAASRNTARVRAEEEAAFGTPRTLRESAL